MYCSACGSALTPNLTYCNRCGARVGGNAEQGVKSGELSPDGLVWSIVAMFVMGIGVIIGLMAVMKQAVNFEWPIILAVTMLGFGLLVVIETVLITLLVKRVRRSKASSDVERLKEQTPRELGAASPRGLSEPMPSVTEHTTRAFEPIYIERK